jgi:hypothetical protein
MSDALDQFVAFIEGLPSKGSQPTGAQATIPRTTTSPAEGREYVDVLHTDDFDEANSPTNTAPFERSERAKLSVIDARNTAVEAIQRAWPGAVVLPADPDPPLPPPERLVQRLVAALMTPRPWMRITDPERARGYFEARARHILATRSGDLLALIEREERAAERWAVSATRHDAAKERHHG